MVSKWATKLNHSRMSRRRQTRHKRRNKLKIFVRADSEPWPRRQSSRCQDYDQVASHEEVSNQSKPRGATPLASRALSGVHWQCQIGPQGVRPCFVRQVSRRRFWRQEDDVLKQCERLKKSRGYRDGAGRISKKMCISGMGQLHQDAVRRTAAMSVNSDAVVQSGQSLRRRRHAVGRVSCAWPVTMCRVAWKRRPGPQQLAVRRGTGTIGPGSSDSRHLPGSSVIARSVVMWTGFRPKGACEYSQAA